MKLWLHLWHSPCGTRAKWVIKNCILLYNPIDRLESKSATSALSRPKVFRSLRTGNHSNAFSPTVLFQLRGEDRAHGMEIMDESEILRSLCDGPSAHRICSDRSCSFRHGRLNCRSRRFFVSRCSEGVARGAGEISGQFISDCSAA